MVSGTPKTEFVLNPGTLRQLSTISDKFRTHVQDVQVAHQSTQSRASLQVQEFARQQQIYSKAATLFAELSETRQVAARKRLDDIQLKHNQLLGRMDRILKKLMLRASPELNEHETRWFNELGRMKQEIIGANTNDQDSLSAKTDMVRAEMSHDVTTKLCFQLRGEVDELLQRVKAAKTEEPRRWDLTGKNEVLGTSQATQLGLRSQHGYDSSLIGMQLNLRLLSRLADIRHLEKLVLDLAAQVDVSLSVSHPPLTASSL
jgi:nucleoporin NUP82